MFFPLLPAGLAVAGFVCIVFSAQGAPLVPADTITAPVAAAPALFGEDGRHVVAVNQVGYETLAPKRFTAPLSADGTVFEIMRTDGGGALFRGEVRGGVGDFSGFRPDDSAAEYRIALSGRGRAESDPFAIRRLL